MKSAKFFSITTLLLITLLLSTLSVYAERPTRFAVIGDRTGEHQEGIYEQIIAEVARMRPDFALTVGDMIEGYTVDTAVLNREWEEYKNIVKPLACPIYYTPGNHDITYDAALETYRKHIGEPYYSFMIDSLYFIVLDNSRRESNAGFTAEQLEWLKGELEKSRSASYTFVTHHKPFWYELTSANKPDTVHTLLKNYGVDVVFTGHYHYYFSGQYEGVRYVSVGSSGGNTDPGPSGLEYHFVWVTVDSGGIHIAPVEMGAVLPENEVTAQEFAFAQNIEQNGLSFEMSLPINQTLNITQNEVMLTVSNLHQELTVADTLRWDIPDGWTVEPSILPLTLPPGDKTSLRFTIRKTGERLYPAPTVSMRLPVASGKSQRASRMVRLSREAFCGRASQSPTIDGVVSEAVWGNPVTQLFGPEGGAMLTDSVSFYFAYDDSALYLAANCREMRIDSIGANLSGHDAPVHGEDCVGFFFQPDVSLEEVYQVYFNPRGAIFDQKITPNLSGFMQGDAAWNGNYEVKTSVGDNSWTVEARIPISQWRAAITPDRPWGLNFRRKQFRLHTSADWQVPIDYNPETFGKLIFEER